MKSRKILIKKYSLKKETNVDGHKYCEGIFKIKESEY